MKYSLQIGSTYNFTVFSPSVLGDNYNNCKVTGILDFESAMVIQDVSTVHASIYSSLPQGTPSKPNSLIYVKIVTNTGEKRVLAMDWISTEPVLNQTTEVNVKISGVSLSSIPLIRQALISNGFKNIEIST